MIFLLMCSHEKLIVFKLHDLLLIATMEKLRATKILGHLRFRVSHVVGSDTRELKFTII
jgi:hypothetical protein